MPDPLSAETQVALLLTVPFVHTGARVGVELFGAKQLAKLAALLGGIERQLGDLVGPDADAVLDELALPDQPRDRLRRLLARGFDLAQAVERWQTRAISILGRSDAQYPSRLAAHAGDQAPPVLFCAGDTSLLADGGLAIVGSRGAGDAELAWTREVAGLAAAAQVTVISGGARGVDQAAMDGALVAGGKVIGVLADHLERAVLRPVWRDALHEGSLTLVSPFDPGSRFQTWQAMNRNGCIYALADAGLVVETDVGRGGTWAGACEELRRQRPVYARRSDSPGLKALLRKGASWWPEPQSASDLRALLDSPPSPSAARMSPANAQLTLNLD